MIELAPGSLRARGTATATRALLRPLTGVLPANDWGIAVSRQVIARSLAAFGPVLGGCTITPVDTSAPGGARVRGEWVRGPGVTRWDAAILYLHGSGYALCSPRTHRGLVSRLSLVSGLPVFCVDYRLAPRHPFPTAADDVVRAFDWLMAEHHSADRIVLAGDSVGGHLAIDLCLSLLRSGRPLPAAQVLFSPIADLTLGLAQRREQARPDPMISAAAARRLLELYTRGVDPLHARLAHVPAAGEVLPPTLIQAGGLEMLAADAHHLQRCLTATGTDSRLEVWPDQMHVFQALPRLVPEARRALVRAGAFLQSAVPAVTRSSADRRSA
ncbi:MAG: alpha/beta hydrolase [Jatrophihabitans sp.]